MTQAETETFDPLERIAELASLSRGYANQIIAARESGGRPSSKLTELIRDIGSEALAVREEFCIGEEDFFEATFQEEGWRDRIAHR